MISPTYVAYVSKRNVFADIDQRTQYINAQKTLSELLNMGVIPIVNENDTIAVAVPTSPSYVAIASQVSTS